MERTRHRNVELRPEYRDYDAGNYKFNLRIEGRKRKSSMQKVLLKQNQQPWLQGIQYEGVPGIR